MKLAFQRAALKFAVVLAMAPIGARAEGEPSMENPCEMTVLKQRCEIALDIDRDGRMNRAVLVRHPTGPSADLSIYLAAGDDKIDPARKPAISREDLASGAVMQLGASGRGSLTVGYGCGGCSDDVETTLTIVHRGGDFWVAGFICDWETRLRCRKMRYQLADRKRRQVARARQKQADQRKVYRRPACGVVGRETPKACF
jgi:hypothetical protein